MRPRIGTWCIAAALATATFGVPSAVAAESCTSVDIGGARLVVGGVDRTTPAAVALAAGPVSIPSASAGDAYPARSSVTQASERYEIEFLDASGSVVARSAPTGDLPDRVATATWVGALPTVDLPVAVVAVRAHHRPDLPDDGSPQSVEPGTVTLCRTTAPTTTAPPTTPTSTVPPTTSAPPATEAPTSTTEATRPPETTTTSPTTSAPPTTDVAGPVAPPPTNGTTSTTAPPPSSPPSTTLPTEPPATAPPTTAPPTTAPPTTAPPTTAPPSTVEEVAGPTIGAPADPSGTEEVAGPFLAFTGTDPTRWLVLATGLVLMGSALVLGSGSGPLLRRR